MSLRIVVPNGPEKQSVDRSAVACKDLRDPFASTNVDKRRIIFSLFLKLQSLLWRQTALLRNVITISFDLPGRKAVRGNLSIPTSDQSVSEFMRKKRRKIASVGHWPGGSHRHLIDRNRIGDHSLGQRASDRKGIAVTKRQPLPAPSTVGEKDRSPLVSRRKWAGGQ